ncbi:hypothetical protein EW146_g5852 [Bondarzewia mesenterica]|uniref:Importin N-terminal domain-containing protein n=1 Tax=Bondarzewia mesenterica TaxID=1095465 RepID=A0A4S4LQ71_9AGAM|nr:hypothetical protein EW146_g5852 [Bondarzewia mesenterica]
MLRSSASIFPSPSNPDHYPTISDISVPRNGIELVSRSNIDLDQMSIDFQDSPEGETYTFDLDFPRGPWRAWCTVLGAWLIQFCTMGVATSYGVFQDFYTTTYFTNHSTSAISWVGAVQLFLALGMGPISGRLFDSRYARLTLTVGSILYVFSFFMLSFARPSHLYQVFLSQGIGMGFGIGLICLPTYVVVSWHFKSRRVLALGIVNSGSAFGGIAFSSMNPLPACLTPSYELIILVMINRFLHGPLAVGFGWTVRDVSLIALNILVVGNILIFIPPRPPLPPTSAKMKDKPSMITIAWCFISFLGTNFPLFYIQLFARTQGIPNSFAFYVLAIMNAAALLGCVLPNLIASPLGTLRVLFPCAIVAGLVQFAIFGASSIPGLTIFIIFYGIFTRATGVVLRKYVTERWSPYFSQFRGGAPPVEVKAQIRQAVFGGLSDSDGKIRSLCAHITSTIANSDWPDEYPELLNSLINLLCTGTPYSVHGVMQVFTEFIRTDLSEDQILPVLRQLLPALLAILGAHEQHSAITRSRTVAVFRQCVEALYMVKEQHPQAVKEASSSILPPWLEAFKVLLNLDPRQDVLGDHWDGLQLRSEIFVVLDIVHTSFPRVIGQYLPDYLSAALNHLHVLFPIFSQHFIADNSPIPDSSEDTPIEMEKLVSALVDFISSVGRRGRAAAWFEGHLPNLIDISLQWAQMTKENEEDWSEDANLFVTQEDDDTQSYCVRVAVFDMLASLLDRSPVPTTTVLQAAAYNIVQKSRQARDAGDPEWQVSLICVSTHPADTLSRWRSLEGLLAVIGSQSESIIDCINDEEEAGRPKPIDIQYLLSEVIPSLLTLSERPFLQGRCLVFASRYAKLLPVEIAGQYLEAAVQVIESRETGIPFKISAVKATLHFCQGLDDSVLETLAPRIAKDLGPFLLQTTDDTLSLVLETLSVVVEINNGDWLNVKLGNDLIYALLEVWSKNLKGAVDPALQRKKSSRSLNVVIDPILLSMLSDIVTSIVSSSNSGVYQAAVRQALPRLGAAIGLSDPKQFWIASSAIELVSALVQGAPETGLGEGFFAAVADNLFNCLKTAEDRDTLQNGISLITLVIRKDVDQLLTWSDANRQSGLGNVLTVIAKMLQSQDESGGLVIGDLIIHLLRKAGDAVLPVLPDLLEAMLGRMRTAKTASFLQSLVIPFCFLIYNQRDIVLNLVENVNIEGRSGLDILINTWCENAETFQGFWATRISALALCQLFLAERPSLQLLMVKGDIIVTPEMKNVIQTRSRTRNAPHQFTSIPFHLKALKLLLHELVSNGEAATMFAAGGMLEVPSDDGDDEWEEDPDDVKYLSELINGTGGSFDEDETLDQDDDEDLKNDPIAQIDLKAHLVTFVKECAARNASNIVALAGQLSEEETTVMQRVVQDQQ